MSNDVHQHIVATIQKVKKSHTDREWDEAVARAQMPESPSFPDPVTAELLAEFGRLPIVYAEDLTPADADARPVASAKPKHG
jgi:hypothetical protein